MNLCEHRAPTIKSSRMTLNKIEITGRIETEPAIGVTSTGVPVARFVLSTAADESKRSGHVFHVFAWNRLAEHVSENMVRESSVLVEGRSTQLSYQFTYQIVWADVFKDSRKKWLAATPEKRILLSDGWRYRRREFLEKLAPDRLRKFMSDVGLVAGSSQVRSDLDYTALYHGLGLRNYGSGAMQELVGRLGALDELIDNPQRITKPEWLNPVLKKRIDDLRSFRNKLLPKDRAAWDSLTANLDDQFKSRRIEFFKQALLNPDGAFSAMKNVFLRYGNLRDPADPIRQASMARGEAVVAPDSSINASRVSVIRQS
jgi:hypothetical protein